MTNVFLSFLETSIVISIIIVLLLLLTPVLNKRYAAKWKYWIWIVVALRLMIPLGGDGGQPIADRQPKREPLTSQETEKPSSDAPVEGPGRGRVVVEIPAQMTAPIVIQPEKTGGNISVLDIIAFVWVLGSLLFISVHLISYFHYKHQILKKGRIVKDKDILCPMIRLKRELHIGCTISVIEYPEAASPMMIGFFKHVLVLPKEQYHSEELFFILKHELIHLKRRDLWFKLLFVVANAVHWFNPLVWIMQKQAAVDMELSCDERVTKGTDYDTRKAYTETLLSTLHKKTAKKTGLTTEFYGGKQIMKKRFKNILTKKGKKNGVAVLICSTILAVSLGTLVGCSLIKENAEDESGSSGTKDIQSNDSPNDNNQTYEPSPEPDPGDNEYHANGDENDGQLPLSLEESYQAVLLNNGEFFSTDLQNKKINLTNIKEVVTDDDDITVTANKFAMIDLNNDGENEVILWLQINGVSDFGFEILRYQEGSVYGYTLFYRAFMDLKTDGTFIFSGGAADWGIGKLSFSGNEYTINKLYYCESRYDSDNELEVQYFSNGTPYSEEEFNDDVSRQEEKGNVSWYDVTTDNVRAVLGQ
ncbi:MAG: M56 family metallopeptidase [Lachnospiraceae bacterium]|nr:M56 family metallopeptidase [Lachnospiraceae bacterium]